MCNELSVKISGIGWKLKKADDRVLSHCLGQDQTWTVMMMIYRVMLIYRVMMLYSLTRAAAAAGGAISNAYEA